MIYPLADLYDFMQVEIEHRERNLDILTKYHNLTPSGQNEIRIVIDKLKQITALIECAEKAGTRC